MTVKIKTFKIVSIKNGDINITYDTKEDKVSIDISRRIIRGDIVGTEYMSLPLDYAKHLAITINELVNEVSKDTQ